MRRRRKTFAALASAITAGALLVTSLTAVPAATAADTVVSSVDFEDGTLGGWTQSGGGADTLTYAADPDDASNQVLSVNGRDADYAGIESPTSLFEEGTVYTFSARVRLAADAPADSTSARFVVKDGFHWADGSNTTITKTSWTTITGTRTADADDSSVYIGTNDLSPAAPYTYLVDDILITAPSDEPSGPVTVLQSDFETDTAPWAGRGATIAQTDAAAHGGSHSLAITDRANTWSGASIDVATLFDEGVEYSISAWVRLADPSAAAIGVNLGVNQPGAANEYPWVGSRTTVDGTAWVQLSGTYTSDPATPAAILYVEAAEAGVDLLLDDVLITAPETDPNDPPTQAPGTVLLETGFDDGELDGWFPRQGSDTSNPTVSVVEGGALATSHAVQVSERTHEGDGVQHDVKDVLLPGATYALEAYVRFAPGSDLGRGLTVSMRTVNGGSQSFANLIQVENATATGWTRVSGQFTVPGYDTAAELYFEARYNSGNTSTFLVDQVKVWVPEPSAGDLSLTPLKDTVDFPVGVAIDQRETSGGASDVVLHHFDQITAENHMKVEAWYNADKQFTPHSQAAALLDYARDNDLRVYGHVLLWHSQTPDWFFQDETGRELTDSDADKQFLRDRLRTHVFAIAEWISSEYGLFGSDTNPLTAWDVVNEVVSDQATPDGLRPSAWYRVFGEEYIHLAFQYADEAFNEVYADPSADRPVKLFINDYNTEQDLKGDQYQALVERLLDAGVPVDGVGHQFHVSINTPISALEAALDRFAGSGLLQAVTEMDVTINPANEPNRIKQGHFYRDAFDVFRAYEASAPAAEKLYSVTVWGLTDTRSWRSAQQPLLFDGSLAAKPAYFGAAGDDEGVPPLINTANVFEGDVALEDGFTDAVEWRNLPENVLTGGAGGFQTRWNADHLTVLVRSAVEAERVEFTYRGEEYVYAPGAAGSVAGADAVVDGEHFIAVHLPHADVTRGSTAPFDVRVVGAGGTVAGGWNSAGSTGTLTFLEPLSLIDVREADATPTVDATIDEVWSTVDPVTTATRVEGSAEGAKASVRTLWRGDVLYVLYEVTDPVIDVANSDPWNQDGVELFLDLENRKTGAYGPNDAQFRVTVENNRSFGTGDAAAQAARLESATALADGGYIVELAVDLTGQSGGQSDVPLGGPDTFHGIDFQVNDGRDGARYSVHTWAEPTGTGYQTTARWGVAHLVAADDAEPELVNLVAPSIVGKVAKSMTVTADPGEWSLEGVTYTYQWLVDGEPLGKKDTSATYKPKNADVGRELSVVVTAHLDGFEPVSATSAPVVVAKK